MSAEHAPVKEGDVLAGKFRVERVLGAGGMGVVVAAHHLQLDERVALKFLYGASLQSADVVARFAREAKAAAKIKSEHVARVLDVGALENGAPYMVMEFLEGSDLAGVLQQRGPLPVADVCNWILQALEALAEAHALGIVHRDLKPANLFLARQPARPAVVKVLDFGISKAASGSEDKSLTATSAVMGSPLYMSPEQLSSAKSVDARADIWSIGVILHELLAGKPPFDGESVTEVIAHILQNSPSSLAQIRPDLPAAIVEIVARCLEKDRTKRFANVGQLAHALAPLADARAAHVSLDRIEMVLGPTATTERPPSPAKTMELAPTRLSTDAWGGTRADLPKRSSPAIYVVVALVVVAVGGAGAWIALHGKGEPPVTVPVSNGVETTSATTSAPTSATTTEKKAELTPVTPPSETTVAAPTPPPPTASTTTKSIAGPKPTPKTPKIESSPSVTKSAPTPIANPPPPPPATTETKPQDDFKL